MYEELSAAFQRKPRICNFKQAALTRFSLKSDDDFMDADYYDELDSRKYDQAQMLSSVSEGNLSLLRKLISRGVNPDFWDKFKRTPLHIAAAALGTEDGKEMVELLVYYGATLERRDRFGQIPLHIASGLSSDGVYILLEAGSYVNAQDNAGKNILIQKDRFGQIPLHIASGLSSDGVYILLEAGSYVNAQDNAGRTPLMLACHGDSAQALTIVQYLLDRGAKVGAKDSDGQTALHYVTSNMKMDLTIKNEIVYKLLYAGSFADAEDNRGRTALLNELRFAVFNTEGASVYNNNDDEDNIVLIHRRLTVYKLLIRAGAQLLTQLTRVQPGWYLFNQLNQRPDLCTILLNIALPVSSIHTKRTYLHSVREELKSVVYQVNNIAEFMHRLKLSVENAVSLKETCRLAVRERLGHKVLIQSSKLGLPKELEKYVTYAECS